MRVPILCLTLSVVAVAGCGGSASTDDPTPADSAPATGASTEPAATEPPATEPPATDAPTTLPAPTTEPPPTLPEPAPWDAPRFDEAIEPTMAALAVGVGQPISAAAVAPEVVLPEGVPSPGGNVTGAGWEAERDPRDGDVELTYAVGLDLAIAPADLEAWQTSVGESGTGWRAPSFAESGSLYTSLLIDEQDQRLVHVLDTDAATSGRPPLNLEWSPNSDAVPEPDWLAALPRPDGGVLSEVLVARGLVTAGLGAAGFDGHVFVRFDYEVDDLDRMIEYFESGILLGAGFEYEPEPLSNARYRRDVAIGDWSGEVLIGEASANDREFLQVIWQLTRGAP